MFPKYPRRLLAAALASCFLSTSAWAQLPAPVKAGHPHIHIEQSDILRMKKALHLPVKGLPETAGRLSFTFKPQVLPAGSGGDALVVFGRVAGDGIGIRYLPEHNKAGKIAVQFAISKAGSGSLIANELVEFLPNDKGYEIVLSWDAVNQTASLAYGGGAPSQNFIWKRDIGPSSWRAKDLVYAFHGRGDVSNVKLTDLAGNDLLDPERTPYLDLELQTAWDAFQIDVQKRYAALRACSLAPVPVRGDNICDTAYQGRKWLRETAVRFALAYKLTGLSTYLEAAVRYADQLLIWDKGQSGNPLGASVGGEWAMGARVNAMGILYDWLYDELRAWPLPRNEGNYPDRLAQRIIDTIKADNPGEEDLLSSICGPKGRWSSEALQCSVPPSWTERGDNSIANYYIGGHQQSAISGAMAGLLAIAPERPDVLPLLDTMYQHFEKGFLPVRDYIAPDGGSHMGFAYGGTEMPERLMLWNKALKLDGAPGLWRGWIDQLIYPYIYGQRHDGTLPARSDVFEQNDVRETLIGAMALAAIVDKQDPVALEFYNQSIKKKRVLGERSALIQERLLYPFDVFAEGGIQNLPLSRHFGKAGQVLMRDSWNDGRATLLDFKSSSFVSENHQHMDQNSFALSYKGPLLLDSGFYDSYGSTSWLNYYRRTIAHNSIVVFDEKEDFHYGGVKQSNDGGQWFNDGQATYPTLAEIQPGRANYLHGITQFEDGGLYSYAVGNASRAYSSAKMDQQNGFVRSVLFLRPGLSSKPAVLVFDRVVTKQQNFVPTSLLHSAAEPAVNSKEKNAENQESNGRYVLNFNAGATPVATISNGKGKVKVSMLLPENPRLVLAGGIGGGNNCVQRLNDPAKEKANVQDCRFTVRERVNGSATYQWVNYPPNIEVDARRAPDVGAWRMEISPASGLPALQPYYFLNVMSVDEANASDAFSARRLAADDGNTEAVLLEDQLVVIFNRGATAAASYSWTAEGSPRELLATGLQPNKRYSVSRNCTASVCRYKLVPNEQGSASSAQGVLNVGL